MRIERATYGAVGEGHALLTSSLPREQLPALLEGRTDRPPGILEPGIRWSPSIGCAPMGSWWVCWRTVEDTRTRRGGMVRTQVALVPLDALGELHDLRPLFELLAVDEPQAAATELVTATPTPHTPAGYHDLVARLIAGASPVVVPDVFALLDLVCALWPRLWPRARRNFAARMLFDPESGGGPSLWWIVATPQAYAKLWPHEQRVTLQDMPREAPGMAMAWLLGESRPSFERMLALVESLDSVQSLRSIEWLVDREPALAREDAAEDTLEFLRQAVELVGPSGGSHVLVRRAAEALARQLPRAGIDVILGLANIHAEPLTLVGTAVARWIEHSLPTAPDHDAVRLLQRLERGRSAPWWLEVVGAGLAAGLTPPNSSWLAAMLRWWAQAPTLAALDRRLPADSAAESALLAALPADFPAEVGSTLRGMARARGWSRLHGTVLASTHEPAAAYAEQRLFMPDAEPGLYELCKRWSAEILVDVAVDMPGPVVVEAAADAIRKDRQLLARINPLVHGWRLVWLRSIARGADPWIGIQTPSVIFHTLINLVIEAAAGAGELVDALIHSAHANLLGHPERAQQWSRLPPPLRSTLLQRTADAWLQALVAGTAMDLPEAPLVAMIQDRAETALGPRISGETLVRFLAAITPRDRYQAANLFRKLQRPLSGDAARALGRSIRENGWQEIARAFYYDRGYNPNDLDPLLEQCASLLGVLQRWRLGRLERGDERPDAVLLEFLVERFGYGAFRRWIDHGPDGRKILTAMPGPNTPLAEQVAGAISELGSRGKIDDDFFDRLRDEFPNFAGEIAELRQMYRRRAWP